MIEQLRRTPERLCILCTQNRVCNYDDLSVSVFVNQHAAFVLDGASGGAQRPTPSAPARWCTSSMSGWIISASSRPRSG